MLFSALTVLFSTAIGLSLAVVLNWEALKYRTLYRTLLFLPYAVPGFISILVFKGLFNHQGKFLPFFTTACWITCVLSVLCIAASMRYFGGQRLTDRQPVSSL